MAKNILGAVELEIGAHNAELATRGDLLALKSDLLRLEYVTKAEIAAVRTDLKVAVSELSGKIDSFKGEMARWFLAAFLTAFGILVAAFYFFLNHARK